MPLPKNRSNSMRKIVRRTPNGKVSVRFKRVVKGKNHADSFSGERLQGVNTGHRVPASQRRPNRKFGGTFSSAVSARIIKTASRVKEGKLQLSDVDVRLLPHVKGLLSSK